MRVLVNGHEREPSSAALDFAQSYAEIPPAAADGYTVQHAWPGDLDGDRPGHPGYEYWTSGARKATPFYGDFLGDRREEILAETGDHTALRLHTTTEPTKTRIYRLARNPAHRLGWTVRGCLQSTYTDYCLGTETRRVPKPAITTTARTEGTS